MNERLFYYYYFDEVLFIYFFFEAHGFGIKPATIAKESIDKSEVIKIYPYIFF